MLPIEAPGYKTSPDFIQIHRMSEWELRNIRDFSISNSFGKIEWPGVTDLTEVNLEQCVNITKKQAEVYPESMESEGLKPEVGQKLNKNAIITLHDYKPRAGQTMEAFKIHTINQLEKGGCRNIRFEGDSVIF